MSFPDLEISEKTKQSLNVLNTVRAYNRRLILEDLKRKSITSVSVVYDGYGDSGGITDFEVNGGKGEADLTDKVVSQVVEPLAATVFDEELTLKDLIESLAMELVESDHGGWENNEGGSGTVTFDTQAMQVRVEHVENYLSHEEYTHIY